MLLRMVMVMHINHQSLLYRTDLHLIVILEVGTQLFRLNIKIYALQFAAVFLSSGGSLIFYFLSGNGRITFVYF